MATYARLPVAFSHGEGVYLFDTAGRRYLDGIAGVGVNGLGHAHPAVVAAVQQQVGRLIHTSNLYRVAEQEQAAAALCTVAGMENCFFGNSGAEANEAAITLARLYGHQRGIDKPAVVVMEGAFHGRTLATLSATGNRKIQAGFEPLVSGFVRAPLNDIAALRQIAANNADVAAVLVEPIQGEGGLRPAQPDYLQAVRQLCDEQQWLLMLDEVQTGNGRTGSYFAYQPLGLLPDVVTTAKGLGNGLPIGACLARGTAATLFQPGHHATTYGGSPLVCAAARAVVRTIVDEGLDRQAALRGQQLRDALADALAGDERVVEIRNRGLMLGIELRQDCGELVARGLEQGVLINVTAGKVVRLLPPLIISEGQVAELASTVSALVRSLN
ncbi:MAG: aspartate aminotransferase family protein [Parahaliea sp.]